MPKIICRALVIHAHIYSSADMFAFFYNDANLCMLSLHKYILIFDITLQDSGHFFYFHHDHDDDDDDDNDGDDDDDDGDDSMMMMMTMMTMMMIQ